MRNDSKMKIADLTICADIEVKIWRSRLRNRSFKDIETITQQRKHYNDFGRGKENELNFKGKGPKA
jgi:hypothetical protein